MRFTQTRLDGVLIVDLDRHVDERGFFARISCTDELVAVGANGAFPQCNISHNPRRGTLRGVHYQSEDSLESKLVRCVAGAVHDVVVDLRPGSPTRLESITLTLSRENGRAVYIPSGIGHGFLTLTDDTDVLYQMGAPYRSSDGAGVRWNDPHLGLEWPFEPIVISERDRSYPDFDIDR